MKFGLLIAGQQSSYLELRFFQYDRLKRMIESARFASRAEFLHALDHELQLLDEAYSQMLENEDSRLIYEWGQLNAVAAAKITKKWNRRASGEEAIPYRVVAECLQSSRFYSATYSWAEAVECGICMEMVSNPVRMSSACSHVFCASCAVKAACASDGQCPLCRRGGPQTLALRPPGVGWGPPASALLSSLQRLEELSPRKENEERYKTMLRNPPSPCLKPQPAPWPVPPLEI
jgi:hypothetical protein